MAVRGVAGPIRSAAGDALRSSGGRSDDGSDGGGQVADGENGGKDSSSVRMGYSLLSLAGALVATTITTASMW